MFPGVLCMYVMYVCILFMYVCMLFDVCMPCVYGICVYKYVMHVCTQVVYVCYVICARALRYVRNAMYTCYVCVCVR